MPTGRWSPGFGPGFEHFGAPQGTFRNQNSESSYEQSEDRIERESARERQRQRDRETDRERQRQTETDRQSQLEPTLRPGGLAEPVWPLRAGTERLRVTE
eukprot:1870646-Rhodomonas_salina.3